MQLSNPKAYWDRVVDFLTTPLFSISNSEFTLITFLGFLFWIVFVFVLASRLSRLLERKILPKYLQGSGLITSISTLFKYAVLVIGLMIIFQSAGINLSSLSILAGAVGVGIGFGLQNIANNFISGLIILFEQPIKVGDRIEVGNIVGNVETISARSTTIVTNDNISVIVPNAQFIDSTVINWSYHDSRVRFRYPVGVSYKEDPEKIKQILKDVAMQHPGILKSPEPEVLFDGYGDSSLDFMLLVWTTEYTNRPPFLKSDLYYAIFKKFKELGVEIPYPQRDLHLRSGFDRMKDIN
jgi:small-conductance mechanosensitive channel